MLVIENYLLKNGRSLEELIGNSSYSETQLNFININDYSDSILRMVAKLVHKKKSIVLYELLLLENPRIIVSVSSDYALLVAIENRAPYIFITKTYRKKQTKFIQEVLVNKNIYELEFGWLAKFNFIGKMIQQAFISSLPKSEDF